ncbi:MAG TPA: Rrf2 family transcriptional regulator, partial [Euzebyales bacterium]|nr:Rrf2 family transcriptional regulator [Euzebyales bacterium]
MWVSRRTDYATRAVLALAMAGSDRPMRTEELSRRTQVPASVLEQIMPLMRNDGIVRSERGRYGGSVL